jgi:hypothetical protein
MPSISSRFFKIVTQTLNISLLLLINIKELINVLSALENSGISIIFSYFT